MSEYRELAPWSPEWTGESPRRVVEYTDTAKSLLTLAGLVFLAIIGALATWVSVTAALTLLHWASFWLAWRIGLLLAMIPPLLLALASVRLLLAFTQAIIERLVGLDLNASGAVGDVVPAPIVHSVTVARPPEQRPLRIEVLQEGDQDQGARADLLDLDLSPETARLLAMQILDGHLSERELAGVGISRCVWTQARDVFLARGLLEWKSDLDKRQGMQPTAVGQAVFESMVHADVRACVRACCVRHGGTIARRRTTRVGERTRKEVKTVGDMAILPLTRWASNCATCFYRAAWLSGKMTAIRDLAGRRRR
jgi:hypothetical protein